MSELSPDARALIDAARGVGPDAAAIARMRGKIELAVTGGAATAAKLGSTTGSAKAIAAGSTLALGTAGKLGVAALVLAAGVGLFAARRDPTPTALGPLELPSTASTASTGRAASHVPGPPASSGPADRVASPTPASSSRAPLAAPAIRPIARDPRGASTPRPATQDAAQPPVGVTLAREVELVDRAMVALTAGDPAGALAAVRLHARETAGRGQLAEDATAIQIEALCTQRSPVAARELARFDARWPSSAQRARLTRVCR